MRSSRRKCRLASQRSITKCNYLDFVGRGRAMKCDNKRVIISLLRTLLFASTASPHVATCAYSASLLECIVSDCKRVTSPLFASRALLQSRIAHIRHNRHTLTPNVSVSFSVFRKSFAPATSFHPDRWVATSPYREIWNPAPSFAILCFDYATYPSPFMVGQLLGFTCFLTTSSDPATPSDYWAGRVTTLFVREMRALPIIDHASSADQDRSAHPLSLASCGVPSLHTCSTGVFALVPYSAGRISPSPSGPKCCGRCWQ